MTEPVASEPETAGRATAQTVHALMHFGRVVRYRQNIVFGAVAVGLVLGAAYYFTATRYYQSKASLLVLQTGADVAGTAITPEGMRPGLMPTYERLFASAVVLEDALRRLAPADRVDLAAVPQENWLTTIRQNLTATTIRQTNIIELAYRSKSAKASVAVVEAVLKAYLDFMDKTHKGTVGELIQMLTRDKAQIDERIAAKQAEVLQARHRFGDLGIPPDSKVVHPMVQRVLGMNEALLKAQEKRIELQASLAAIQAAVRDGADLQQHMLALEGSVGREFLMSLLGFSSRDQTVQANLERGRIEDEAQLRMLLESYGENHPRVMEVQERISRTREYLDNYQAKVDARLAQVRDRQLGPMLVQMVQQRLAEAWQHENTLRSSFERARADAVAYSGDSGRLQILEDDLRFLREFRDVLLSKLASVDLHHDQGDIRTAVVTEPRLPKWPIWPKLPLVAVVCLTLGLVVGLALVYVLDILDDRFRSPEELRAQLGVPVLAMVRQMRELEGQGLDSLHFHAAPSAVESEAFRTLRTALAFSHQHSQRIAISSAEPGDGKTTVLANLAVCYAQSGKRTLLIDADMRRPGLSSQLGFKGQSGLSDVLISPADVAELAPRLIRSTGLAGLDVLPAGPRRPNPAEMLAGPRLAELLAWAESIYDQVLVDSPPALAATDASIVGRLVDGLVLVVQPKKNQRRLVMRAADSLTGVGVRLFGVVVNRISGDKSDSVYGYGSGYGYGYGYGYGSGYGYGEAESPDAEQQATSQEVTAATPDNAVLLRRRAADESSATPAQAQRAPTLSRDESEPADDAPRPRSPRKRSPRSKPSSGAVAAAILQTNDAGGQGEFHDELDRGQTASPAIASVAVAAWRPGAAATDAATESTSAADEPRAAPPPRPPIVPRRVA